MLELAFYMFVMFLLSVFRKTKAPLLFKRLLSISDIVIRYKIIFLSYNLIFVNRVLIYKIKNAFFFLSYH